LIKKIEKEREKKKKKKKKSGQKRIEDIRFQVKLINHANKKARVSNLAHKSIQRQGAVTA
jgi:hypothetical protein